MPINKTMKTITWRRGNRDGAGSFVTPLPMPVVRPAVHLAEKVLPVVEKQEVLESVLKVDALPLATPAELSVAAPAEEPSAIAPDDESPVLKSKRNRFRKLEVESPETAQAPDPKAPNAPGESE